MQHRTPRPGLRWIATAFIAASLMGSAGIARADDTIMQVLSFIAPGLGGYWFTNGSAHDALGSPKFLGNTTFYVKYKNYPHFRLTGGYQEVSIKDHWQPFSGGNHFTMDGAAFKLTTIKRNRYDTDFFANGGIFLAHIHSEKMGFKDDKVLPSIAFGVEKEVMRYVKISAGYRITPSIHGVDTSGGYISLGLFP